MVHVVCALAMYIFWIGKPYDIYEPTVVAKDEFPEALAFFVASSRWSDNSGLERAIPATRKRVLWRRASQNFDPPFGYLGNLSETSRASSRRTGSVFDTKTPIQETPEHSIEGSLCVEQALGDGVGAAFDDTGELGRMIPGHAELMLRDSFIPVLNIESVLHLNSGQALDSGYGPIDEPGATAAESPRYRNYQLKLSQKDIDRLNMAATFARKFQESDKQAPTLPLCAIGDCKVPRSQLLSPFSDRDLHPYGGYLICSRAKNWPGFGEVSGSVGSFSFSAMCFALMFTATVYGGIHQAASSALLPTASLVRIMLSSTDVCRRPVCNWPGCADLVSALCVLFNHKVVL